MTFQKQSRPIPEDFAEQAKVMSRLKLSKHYGTRPATIVRWASEAGIPPRTSAGCKLRPVPADFAHFSVIEGFDKLVARYGCSSGTITRWRRETGTVRDPVLARPAPEGFHLFAPNHTVAEMRVRYGRGPDTIRRWCRECGVEPRKPATAPGRATLNFSPQNHAHRDTTRAGLAADFLRHLGPVFRCNPDGHAKADGSHWNRGGRTILTDAEIIERAERNGWRPDAWKDLAA